MIKYFEDLLPFSNIQIHTIVTSYPSYIIIFYRIDIFNLKHHLNISLQNVKREFPTRVVNIMLFYGKSK